MNEEARDSNGCEGIFRKDAEIEETIGADGQLQRRGLVSRVKGGGGEREWTYHETGPQSHREN